MDTKKRDLINFILVLIGLAAIIASLLEKELNAANILDAVRNIATMLVTIAVYLISLYNIEQNISREDPFLISGTDAMEKIKKKYSHILIGPCYSRENYDPKKGKGQKYLFIKEKNKKLKAQIMSLQLLQMKLINLQISTTMMNVLGIVEDRAALLSQVQETVMNKISKKYQIPAESIEIGEAKNDKNRCLEIDCNDFEIDHKKFGNLVFDVLDIAIASLIEKSENAKIKA
ncbi:MAG TPA: hypothetical protein PL048_02960 [Leptospiraceae bacterium]|nr:hypothetical protein [Leptospiraceae bacterium]HMZ57707.1 hypothetical protein [Leptospiraceae bacterium]HNF14311.1 hypothetical protein [Leptospiraceae bacterium]HNF23551.1 hypothetical protein [Leptospiraceae bacterium]HNH07099.1 hypothetical protein [Leptospiraceae bacterium]